MNMPLNSVRQHATPSRHEATMQPRSVAHVLSTSHERTCPPTPSPSSTNVLKMGHWGVGEQARYTCCHVTWQMRMKKACRRIMATHPTQHNIELGGRGVDERRTFKVLGGGLERETGTC